MIALWMMYATIVTAVIGAGAELLDRAASGELRQRRWIWAIAIVLSAAVPAWTAIMPRLGFLERELPILERPTRGELNSAQPGAVSSSSALADLIARADPRSLGKLDTPLAIAWGAAALLAIMTYGSAVASLAHRRRSWRAAEVDGQPVLLAPATGPAVVGALRPQIVVPEWSLDLTAEQRSLMLEHERQHVAAYDPLVLHAAALVTLLMPWNLAAWWLNRRLRLAVELDCDARVLASGRDARAYGSLLLDVCSRRIRSGVLLAPALFERTSSLTRRILAMYPQRPRYARTRFALGTATAVAMVFIACDMPSPEVLAPDGTNQASTRLYGEMKTVLAEKEVVAAKEQLVTRGVVKQYFPEISRGEGPSSILFLVKSASGAVVLKEAQPSEFARTPALDGASNRVGLRERGAVERSRAHGEVQALRFKTAVAPRLAMPSGIGALQPNDIQSVDVSKHAAGTVAPKAVSLITIQLKPGAAVPRTPDQEQER